jgi:endogenous inhibitor of DNA gyrase (YacG/DUF329 family)
MFGQVSNRKIFVVRCKRCQRDVPSGADAFPFQSVAVNCPLCGEQRRYRPSDVFLGQPHVLISAQQKERRGLLWK